MKKFMLALCSVAALAACDTPEETVLLGTAAGAAIGAQTAGRDEGKGALLGAMVGLAAGAAVAAAQEGPQCRYIYPDGREFIDDCP